MAQGEIRKEDLRGLSLGLKEGLDLACVEHEIVVTQQHSLGQANGPRLGGGKRQEYKTIKYFQLIYFSYREYENSTLIGSYLS